MAEDKSSRAGEYVLGTLTAEERSEVERQLASDPELASAVRAWERRLGPLTDIVPEEPPPAEVWRRVSSAVGSEARAAGGAADDADSLRRRLRAWRFTGLVATAAAASLAIALGFALRPETPQPGERYIAAVQSGGATPAVMVSVDMAEQSLTVRSLSLDAPAGRSFEVWYIGNGEQPRSLGVLDDVGSVIAVSTHDIENFRPEGAIFALTDEPEGGSPSGAPTGAVAYSGALIPAAI